MALNFADLKKNRKSDFNKIQQKIESDKTSYGDRDKNYWQPTVDKAGNGYAVIRFLPAPPNEENTFVKLYTHGFKGPSGKWYIENSLTTIGQKDPVGEFNSELFNSTEDDNHPNRKQARAQKRRLSYIANVLVVKDPANPANEGQVKLFKFGKKIWDKVHGAMYPEFEDEEGFNPFDLWEGADFKIKIRQVEGYRNYDKSEFDRPSVVSDDDEYLEKLWKASHSLEAIIAPDQFKSYEELEKKMNEVLGRDRRAAAPAASREVDEAPAYRPRQEKEAAAPTAASMASDYETGGQSTDDSDPDLDYFKSLAEG